MNGTSASSGHQDERWLVGEVRRLFGQRFAYAGTALGCDTFVSDPLNQVLLVATVCPDLRGKPRRIDCRLYVDPLLSGADLQIDVTQAATSDSNEIAPPWRLDSPVRSLDMVARFVAKAQEAIGARFGTYRAFAVAFDDANLPDDLPELAEAVAYAWLLAGEDARSIALLDALSEILDDDRSCDVAERARSVRALIARDPAGARRTVVDHRAAGLARYWRRDPNAGRANKQL